MRNRKKRVATDTWRSLGCRTTPLEHWSRRKPTVEPRWAKQQTKKLRPKPTKINSFMSGTSLSLTPDILHVWSIKLRYKLYFSFNTNPRFLTFLLYLRCKSGVTFIRRSFRDGTLKHVKINRFWSQRVDICIYSSNLIN